MDILSRTNEGPPVIVVERGEFGLTQVHLSVKKALEKAVIINGDQIPQLSLESSDFKVALERIKKRRSQRSIDSSPIVIVCDSFNSFADQLFKFRLDLKNLAQPRGLAFVVVGTDIKVIHGNNTNALAVSEPVCKVYTKFPKDRRSFLADFSRVTKPELLSSGVQDAIKLAKIREGSTPCNKI